MEKAGSTRQNSIWNAREFNRLTTSFEKGQDRRTSKVELSAIDWDQK
jgi:hypothetical protein